jgi:hypothetical protein
MNRLLYISISRDINWNYKINLNYSLEHCNIDSDSPIIKWHKKFYKCTYFLRLLNRFDHGDYLV